MATSLVFATQPLFHGSRGAVNLFTTLVLLLCSLPTRASVASNQTIDKRPDYSKGSNSHQPKPYPLWLLILLSVISYLIAVAICLSNSIVLLAFWLDKTLRKPANYFLVSLALTDLFIGAFALPIYTQAVLQDKWILGPWVCKFWLSVEWSTCATSRYMVFIITMDRFLNVKAPVNYRRWRTKRNSQIIIFLAWLIPFCFFFTCIYGWAHFAKEVVPNQKCQESFLQESVFTIAFTLVNFWIPFFIMGFMYLHIYRVALDMQKQLDEKHHIFRMARKRYGMASVSRRRTTVGKPDVETTQLDADKDENNKDSQSSYAVPADDNIINKSNSTTSASKISSLSLKFIKTHFIAQNTCRRDEGVSRHMTGSSVTSVDSALYNSPKISRHGKGSIEEQIVPSYAVSKRENIDKKFGNNNKNQPHDDTDTFPKAHERNPDNLKTDDVAGQEMDSSPDRRIFTEDVPPITSLPYSSESASMLSDSTFASRFPQECENVPRRDRRRRTYHRRKSRHAVKAFRTITFIFGAYALFFTPFQVCTIVLTVCKECVNKNVFSFTYWLTFLNALADPFCYAYANICFRERCIQILKCQYYTNRKSSIYD